MGEREIGFVEGMWKKQTQFSVQLWGLVLRRLTTRELYCFDQKIYYTLPCNTLKFVFRILVRVSNFQTRIHHSQ